MADMRRDFTTRQELIDYLKAEFPEAANIDEHVPETRGGRQAAEQVLQTINPKGYASTRNYLDGDVTGLSPYIRHGVLTLAEVRDFALQRVYRDTDAEKFVNELGVRDYWQRLYESIGDGIWEEQEDYKTGYAAHQYSDDLPDDIRAGTTGLECIDSFSRELRETGYLHNHVRMYLAAYIIHWRRVKWQAGARWFLEHLLDGDPASNNLSWQWVASTFSHKPYIFNRENLERYTRGAYCQACPLYGRCDFEGSYEALTTQLFPHADFDDEASPQK
ncbi:MAG: FAD-binding domain-containing protein [Anaerolineae bacterium]